MKRRTLSICLAFIVMLALAAPVPAAAKSKSAGPLLKSVTAYNYETNGTQAKWDKSSVTKFTYDKNGYPTQITWDSGGASSMGLKYKYKKKKPSSAKETNAANRKTGTYKYNKKGLVSSYKDSSFLKRSSVKKNYKYNKSGFVSQYRYNRSSRNIWGTSSSSYNAVDNYSYVFKKGLPTQLTASTTTTSTSTGSQPYSYSSKSFATFNSKGLITSWGRINDDGSKRVTNTVKYTKKKGKITSAVVSYVDYYGVSTPGKKYNFSYAKKTSTTKSRFANMINDQISTTVGTYTWY